MKDEFYVGYSDKAPEKTSLFMRKVITVLAIAIVGFAGIVVFSQQRFPNSSFEFGNLSQMTGVLYAYPVPMLKILDQTGVGEPHPYQTLPLVGYGKMGSDRLVDEVMRQIKSKGPKTLEDYEVTVEGTLIYHDGKALLELSNNKNSVLGYHKRSKWYPKREINQLGKVTVKGEIVDSKCFFGVMKPAERQVHRACAIRCIDGGIPPVFVMRNKEGDANYFLLVGKDGEAINKEILDLVALPLTVEGELEMVDDWFVLKADPADMEVTFD